MGRSTPAERRDIEPSAGSERARVPCPDAMAGGFGRVRSWPGGAMPVRSEQSSRGGLAWQWRITCGPKGGKIPVPEGKHDERAA